VEHDKPVREVTKVTPKSQEGKVAFTDFFGYDKFFYLTFDAGFVIIYNIETGGRGIGPVEESKGAHGY
jgi:hypothetical protein